jgi:hypothetical protein
MDNEQEAARRREQLMRTIKDAEFIARAKLRHAAEHVGDFDACHDYDCATASLLAAHTLLPDNSTP